MDSILQDALKKANAEVSEAGITDSELKKIAFSKAIDFYLKSNEEPVQIEQTSKEVSKQGAQDFWSSLSRASTLDARTLNDIYSLKDGQILLIIPSVPGETKADGQRSLAALILFAYQEGQRQEWVSASLLAEAAKHSKLYDTSKFAKNLKVNWFRSQGVKKGLKYKLSGPGISAAKNLLINLTKNHE